MLSKEYLENPRLSQSQLKHILYGASEFAYYKANPSEPSPSQNIGSAVHLLLLQPELYDNYVIHLATKPDKRTKAGKELLQQYEGTSKILLSPDEVIKVESIVDAIERNADCDYLIGECIDFEKSYLYNHAGIPFKAQLDAIGSNHILDVKTTIIKNDDREIRNAIWKYMYHFQAASYQIAAKQTGMDYFIIFARTEPPYTVFPVQLSAQLLQEGRDLFDRACDLYNECVVSNPEFKDNNKIRII